MKITKNRRKKNKGAKAKGVKIPGGGRMIYAHATSMKNGKLVSTPLSRAEARKMARGPLAAMQPVLKAELAKVVNETDLLEKL